MTHFEIQPLGSGDETACEAILRALPDWVGIESALRDYVADCNRLPTWMARNGSNAVGFITVRTHFPHAAEIHCMAVEPTWHRRGVGRRLVDFTADRLRDEGVEFLQVKTLGPSRPCEHYERTRRFYTAMGFVELEEFPTLWPGNPALLMVRRVDQDR